MTKIIFAGGVELSITSICSMNNFTKQKILKSLLFLGILVGAFFEVQAQEVSTKVDGSVLAREARQMHGGMGITGQSLVSRV